MDSSTLDLYRLLQSGPYDDVALEQLKRLLGSQRRVLRSQNDQSALEDLIPLLQIWAASAGGGRVSASALAEAAEIAEIDLRDAAKAELLRTQAISSGRSVSALSEPQASPESQEPAEVELSPTLSGAPTAPPQSPALRTAEPHQAEGAEAPSTALASELPEPLDAEQVVQAQPSAALPGARHRHGGPPSLPAPARAVEAKLNAAPEESAQRPSVPTEPIQLGAGPALKALAGEAVSDETMPLSLPPDASAAPSLAPLPGAHDAAQVALSAAIARAEETLEDDASAERVRELAELYVQRGTPGDREQAADLYCMLGEVFGNPGGIAMLERALAQVPDHAQAKALLNRYTVRPRAPITAPKITVLGAASNIAMPAPPPPAAKAAVPPPSAARSEGTAAPALSDVPRDVLPLHGVPQVVSAPPPIPPVSSLSPVVRSDAAQLQPAAKPLKRFALTGGIALSAAAAFGLYLVTHSAGMSDEAAQPVAASGAPRQVVAASQLHVQMPEVLPKVPKGAAATRLDPAPSAPTPAAIATAEPEREAVQPKIPEPEAAEPEAAEPEAAKPEAPRAQADKTQPVKTPEAHAPSLRMDAVQLRGGKLSEAQLHAALKKAEPKLLACYAQATEQKPRLHGRVLYGFSVRPNGRATNVKRIGGTLRDDALIRCSAKVLQTTRYPKPRKQAAQVKLPIHYQRS